MRSLFVCLTLLAFSALLVPGCSKTSADKLTGGVNACDTTQVSYARDILPIVQQYCYPCHGAGNTAFSDGVSLDSYDALKGWGGYLIGMVTHASGYEPMPYGKPKLDDCEIDKITAWVDQQYPK